MKVYVLLSGWREEFFEYDDSADDVFIGVYSTKEKAEEAMYAAIREEKCFNDSCVYERTNDGVLIDSGEMENWYKVEEVEIDKERSSK